MSNQPSKKDLELARIKSRERDKLWTNVFNLARTIVRGGCWVAAVYLLSDAVKEAAGGTTTLNMPFMKYAGTWLPDVAAVLTGAAWWRERRLRHKAVKSLSAHVARLETTIDPNRSKSGLDAEGRLKKEDRDAAG